jgi:hypothetical protein
VPSSTKVLHADAWGWRLGIGYASRTETIQFTNVNRDLMAFPSKFTNKYPSCNEFKDGIMINGDLKIKQFIYD